MPLTALLFTVSLNAFGSHECADDPDAVGFVTTELGITQIREVLDEFGAGSPADASFGYGSVNAEVRSACGFFVGVTVPFVRLVPRTIEDTPTSGYAGQGEILGYAGYQLELERLIALGARVGFMPGVVPERAAPIDAFDRNARTSVFLAAHAESDSVYSRIALMLAYFRSRGEEGFEAGDIVSAEVHLELDLPEIFGIKRVRTVGVHPGVFANVLSQDENVQIAGTERDGSASLVSIGAELKFAVATPLGAANSWEIVFRLGARQLPNGLPVLRGFWTLGGTNTLTGRALSASARFYF
ncbi:MAG: hypothetical protein AAF658_11850 [Myxococcota bacterium]